VEDTVLPAGVLYIETKSRFGTAIMFY